ncbi:MFS transporter [Nocardioides bruguierae]|uniref:MFS transporter n=1 Tax=Nocardioides bruguierae TaxID=2945102 RepID=A0A9X2D930_9ACTN|nr:MFS transporter [Nocardioides bruguierae]MCM0621406.1 MFS transporter [Nocardioides bruguierae]
MTSTLPTTPVARPTSSPVPAGIARRPWAALVVLVLAVVLLSVDGTVVALAVPALSADLAPTSTQLLWIGDVYSFAIAGFLVTMGGVADRFGRRRVLLVGTTAFGLTSLAAGLAPTPETLIAARALQGVAAATLMPSTLALIRALFPDAARRTRAVAIWAAGAYAGAAAGPAVGGLLLEHFWWGSVFLVNVPVVVLLLVGTVALVPESRDPHPGRLDLVSAGLSLLAVVPVVLAVKEAAVHGVTPLAVAALVVGVLAGATFVRRQRALSRAGRAPLLDLALFRDPTVRGAVGSTLVAVLAFSGLLYFFSQYLQLVRGLGPLQAGLWELPLTAAAVAVIPFAGRAAARFGQGRVIGAGLAVSAAGMALLAVGESAAGYVVLAAALVLAGLGEGFAFTLSTDAVLSAVPADRAGAASAVSETAYELGVALGIGVLGSGLTLLYRSGLDGQPEEVRDSLAGALAHGSDEAVLLAQHAFVDAMQAVSLAAALLLSVAAVVAWRLIGRRRDEDVLDS